MQAPSLSRSLGFGNYLPKLPVVPFLAQVKALFYISALAPLLPFLLSLFRLQGKAQIYRIIICVVWWGLFIQAISFSLWYFKQNNLYLNHLYVFVETGLLTCLYYHCFRNNRAAIWVLIIGGLATFFVPINTLFFQSLTTFNTYAITVENSLLIVVSIYYYLYLLSGDKLEPLGSLPMFWANAAILLYASGSLLIHLASNYLLPESQYLQNSVWGIHAVINIIKYLLYAIALWVAPKR